MPNSNTRTKQEAGPEKPSKAKQGALGSDNSDGQKRKWDIIDEHAWESFPASDPPASWAGRDIAPQDRDDEQRDEQTVTKKHKTPKSE